MSFVEELLDFIEALCLVSNFYSSVYGSGYIIEFGRFCLAAHGKLRGQNYAAKAHILRSVETNYPNITERILTMTSVNPADEKAVSAYFMSLGPDGLPSVLIQNVYWSTISAGWTSLLIILILTFVLHPKHYLSNYNIVKFLDFSFASVLMFSGFYLGFSINILNGNFNVKLAQEFISQFYIYSTIISAIMLFIIIFGGTIIFSKFITHLIMINGIILFYFTTSLSVMLLHIILSICYLFYRKILFGYCILYNRKVNSM